ncbi:MAG TPA: hypothetical protein VH643_19130 [Gemmataceae bacterium]|jgi:hypothetical protein
MNLDSGDARLVLLCPAWKKWGIAKTVKPGTVILHSRAEDVVPFADSEELVKNSGLPASALIEVGDDHRLADPEPLRAGTGEAVRARRGERRKRQGKVCRISEALFVGFFGFSRQSDSPPSCHNLL